MKTRYLKLAVVGLAAMVTLNSCREDIDEGSRFTFVGNTVASYLQDKNECSHFVKILTDGECIGLMKAYGTYTCFAPTNQAIERYLIEQDSIYWDSYNRHKEDPSVRIVETGVHNPSLDSLSKEKCIEIARNHIIPKVYYGFDFKGDLIPDANINDRDLTLSYDSVDIRNPKVPVINKQARIIEEEEVVNGVVHVVQGVVSPSNLNIPTQLSDFDYFKIFSDALELTGYARELTKTEDETYKDGGKYAKSMNESTMIPYPEHKRLRYTVFLVTDAVLKDKYNITSVEELADKCKDWYGDNSTAWVYNEKENDWDPITISHADDVEYTDPRHPLNQFVAYHLLDRKVPYANLVFHNIVAGTDYDSEKDFPGNADRTEYYVTMNNRILKVTKPLSKDDYSIYLNYSPKGIDDKVNVKVIKPGDFAEEHPNFEPEALNGSFNVIEDVLLYDEGVMEAEVLNGIMRFDIAGICPELTNNGIRWNYLHYLTSQADVFIPHDYCKNIIVHSENTRLFYLPPHWVWADYQGDEMMAKGVFDLSYRLPPVPAGTYEIRLGYTANEKRGIVQVYLDEEPTGIPINLTLTGGDAMIGWVDDDPENEEANVKIDNDMYNRGFLKGPKSFYEYAENKTARSHKDCLRAVIARKELPSGSHWLRFKDVYYQKAGQGEFMHDYIEIVPIDYLNSLEVSEEEKRY